MTETSMKTAFKIVVPGFAPVVISEFNQAKALLDRLIEEFEEIFTKAYCLIQEEDGSWSYDQSKGYYEITDGDMAIEYSSKHKSWIDDRKERESIIAGRKGFYARLQSCEIQPPVGTLQKRADWRKSTYAIVPRCGLETERSPTSNGGFIVKIYWGDGDWDFLQYDENGKEIDRAEERDYYRL